MVEVGHTGCDAQAWISALEGAGLRSGAWSRRSLRLVTHRHIGDAEVDQALTIIRSVSATLARSDGKILEKAV